MFFKRSNGEFRETDRVTRFKLIKSGKNWLRASTSNFGLLKVIRGQVEETIVAEVHEDTVSEKGLTSRGFLKGIVVAAAVLSATSLVHTGHADELEKDAPTASALVSAPAIASDSESLSKQAAEESSDTSSEVVEAAPISDDKTILEQNASEAVLLNKIAEKYASNHHNTEQKEAINDAVAKVQSELTAGDKLTDTDATAQTYADQRERLSKSVDDMMATLTAAGFEGNTTVNGAPAISAQLDALSTSNTLTVPSVSPKMDEPNGATIEDPALNNANYQLDPNTDRYTYSIWDLQNWAGPANQGGLTYSNGGYYVTFSVDRSTVGTTTTPVVHARLVEKATGKEVETLDMTAKSTYQFKALVQANPTYAPQFEYTSGEASQILGTWTNNRDAGPTSDDKYKHHILQVRDTMKPGNVGETKPNVQTVVPTEKVTHTTHYKVEGTNKELASYAQTGIESQAYKASNPRTFEGYEFTRTDAEKDMSGFLGGVGAKYLELQGGRAHYYVKRIIEQIDKDGTSVVKLYALDPSKVSSYSPATDVNNLNLDNYTLLYTSDPVKPGGKPTPAGTKDATHSVGFVDSKDGQYHLKVETYTDSGNGNVRLSGWYNKATGDAFTASPQFSADVDPVRNNTSNIIGGNTPGDKASGYPSFFNNYSLPSVKQISTDVTHYYRKSEVTGNVYVHYQDTEGKTIKPDVTDEKNQPVNKAYDTVVDNRPNEITFEGKTYELVPAGNYTVGEVDDQGHLTSSDPTTGAVAKEDKNVTYIYKLKVGEVVITYVDEKGKEIQKPRQDTPNSPYETPYDTTEEGEKPNFIKAEDGKTYKIVPKGDYPVGKVDENGHLEKSDPVTGKVTKPKSTITYVYKEVNGNVYVHYVDTEGKTIKEDVTDEKAQPVDKDYDTVVDNRPQEIAFEGNTYELVPAGNYTVGEVDKDGHLKSTDPTTGKVIEGDKNVTYVYKLKEKPKGEVVITYVDEKGKEIQKPRQDTPNSPYETPYDTTEEGEKPNFIKAEDGKTYKIVPKGDYPVGKVDENGHLEKSDPVTGKVTKPKSTITYVYKEVNGNVYVHYVDTEGKTIKEDVTDEKAQPVDKDYDTVVDNRPQEIEFEGNTYELVPAGNYTVGEVDKDGHLKSTDPTTGKVIEGDKNVTYVYKLKETPDKPVEPTPDKPVEPTPDKPVEPTPDKPVEPTPDKPVEPTPDKPVEPTPDKPVEPTPDKPVEPTPDKPVEPTPDKPVEPTPDKPVEPTPDKPVEPTPDKPVEPTPDKPVEPTPDKPVEPTPDKPVEPTPDKPVEPTPDKPVEPTPDKPVEPTPDKPVEPTPDKPVEPTPDKPVEPTPDKPVEPTPDKPVEPTPDKPVEPTPDKPVEPTPDKPVEPTPDKPVEPTPDKPVEPTPDKPVEPTPDKPVEPTPDKPVEPTPDKPVEPTPDKPVEPTPDKPVEPTPDKPVEPTPDKPVEPTPDKPVEPTPDKPVEPTPDKPVEPTPDKPVEPTPDKPVEPTPDKPVEPTPDKPVEPTPDKPVEPTPDKPVEPTPDKPVEPTPDKPVEPTPDKPVEPTPDKPVEPTPDKPVEPTPDKPVEPTPDKPVEPTPDKPVEPTPDKPVEPTPDKPVEPTPDKPVEPTPDKPVEPTPDKPVEPTPDKPVEPTPDKPVEPTPDKPVEPTPDKPVEPTPDKPVEPTPDKPVEPTPDKPVEPTPDKPVEPTPDKPVEPTPDKPVEPTPDKPVEPTPDKPVEPTPDKPVEPTPDKPVEPTPDKPVEPTPDKPVEPTPDKPVEPTPDKPVEPTPDKPVEPTPDKPVEPTPDKPVEPTPDKPVEPTPDKPVEPTPDKPVEPTPDKPVEPTPDKPVEPTPDKPVEPTPDKPVEPTPDKPVEPTPDKPVEPTPDKPVEPTPDKPVEPTPDKPVEPTPDKPVEPTPDKPVEPTPDKPVEPTPDKPVNPTPDKPVNPTPGKPVDPTPGKPVDPTPGKPVDPTPGKPVDPTPGKPVDPTPDKPVEPTPGKPVNPTPGKPVNPTPGKPVDPTPGKPVNPTPDKPVEPTPGKPVNPTPGKPVDPTPDKPVEPTPGKPVNPTPGKPVSEQLPNTGETTSAGSTVLGVVAGLVGLAALGRRKKEDEK